MNSTDRDTIKLILSIEQKKKKVKISCKNKDEGKSVAEAISNNTSSLMANTDYDLNKGMTYKDFTYKFGSKEEAAYFKSQLEKVKSSTTQPATTQPATTPTEGTTETTSPKNTLMFVLAGVIILIAVFVWRKSR